MFTIKAFCKYRYERRILEKMACGNILKRIAEKIVHPRNPFEYNIKDMKIYLNHFKNPKNDLERSFFQYKCQMKQSGIIAKMILNMGALILLPYYILRLKRTHETSKALDKKKAVFYSNSIENSMLPESLQLAFRHIENIDSISPKWIDQEAQRIIFELMKKYPLSFFLILKCLLKLSMYCTLRSNTNCGSIISSCEYSFTSSILTYYCDSCGIVHINIMHGEKLFHIRDSFFHFDKCYIWDSYYEQLFTRLRASCNDYIVELPLSFSQLNRCKVTKRLIEFKYYLQAESEQELKRIYTVLIALKKNGKSVAVRPHPLYSNLVAVESIFKEVYIESAQDMTIEESVQTTEYVVSLYSTVLFQSYINGRKIVIDDVTRPEQYYKLEELGYIMLNKEPFMLSDLLNDNI